MPKIGHIKINRTKLYMITPHNTGSQDNILYIKIEHIFPIFKFLSVYLSVIMLKWLIKF